MEIVFVVFVVVSVVFVITAVSCQPARRLSRPKT